MDKQVAVRQAPTSESRLGRPVKVLFLEITLQVGGAERLLCNLLNSFDRSRVQPSVAFLGDSGPLGDQISGADISVHSHLGHRKGKLQTLRALIEVIHKERPDIIYTCNYPLTMIFGRLAGLLTGVNRHVVALHSIGYFSRERWRRYVLKLLRRFITALVAVSQGQKRHYVETHGINPSKVEVIYVGVDIDRFSLDTSDQSAKAEFGIPEDALVVGILAALRPEKKHDLFLEMAKSVLSSRGDAYFLIVGDGPERARLEGLADELGIADHVRFAGSRSDVPRMLRIFDVSVLCSGNLVETFPQCLVESMSMSLPVVSTDVGSIDEIVVNGKTGYLVPEGDMGSLTDRVLHLLNHGEEARAMGAAGRRRVEENFSKEAMVRHFENMFEQLVTPYE